jgi:hypothetical protein
VSFEISSNMNVQQCGHENLTIGSNPDAEVLIAAVPLSCTELKPPICQLIGGEGG